MALGTVAGLVGDAGKEEGEMERIRREEASEEMEEEIVAAINMLDVSQFKIYVKTRYVRVWGVYTTIKLDSIELLNK